MSATYSTNAGLVKPGTGDLNWDVSVNGNSDLLDRLSGVGLLMVTPREIPSTSLVVRVAGGSYVAPDGSQGFYAGPATLTLPASATSFVWLDVGTVAPAQGTTGFPTVPHVPLATVLTGTGSVNLITDARVMACAVRGSSGLTLPAMTTTARDAIPSPPEGLLIWNLTTHQANVYNGTSWKVITMT